jgi:DNA-binding response OmpR family regulator
MNVAIVEDEIKLANTLKDGLEAEGYTVSVFTDGESAERELLKNSTDYSLIILDLTLPRKNGFEICKTLRDEGVSIPVLILTARESVEDKVRALDNGADDFLTKPFAFDELMARMRALARRAKGQVSEKITINDLVINMGTHDVTRAGKQIALTPTEFDILSMFIQHPEKAMSREEISMYLWDSKETALSNVVDVHISNLRKKIDDDHDQKIIRTVRGVGYTIQK